MGDTQGAMSPRPLAAQRDEPRIPRRDVEIPTTPDDGAHRDPLTDERLEAMLAEARRRGEREARHHHAAGALAPCHPSAWWPRTRRCASGDRGPPRTAWRLTSGQASSAVVPSAPRRGRSYSAPRRSGRGQGPGGPARRGSRGHPPAAQEEVSGMTRWRSIGISALAGLLATAGAGSALGQDETGDPVFYTTAGPLTEDQVGDVLAHHHMFVELGAVPPVAYLEADPEIVLEVIGPWLEVGQGAGHRDLHRVHARGRRPTTGHRQVRRRRGRAADDAGHGHLPRAVHARLGLRRDGRGDRRLHAHRADGGRHRHGHPGGLHQALAERHGHDAHGAQGPRGGLHRGPGDGLGHRQPHHVRTDGALGHGCAGERSVARRTRSASSGSIRRSPPRRRAPASRAASASVPTQASSTSWRPLERGAYVSLDGIGSGYWTD